MTRQSPCGWEPEAPCASGPCCPDIDAFPNEEQLAKDLAAGILWRLTGMRFGCCPITVRPCKVSQCGPTTMRDLIYFDQRLTGMGNLGVTSYAPTLIDGQVYNIGCGCQSGCCKCKANCEFRLPGPICSIESIEVNGFPVSEADYIVYEPNIVSIQRITKPSTKAGRLIATAVPYNEDDRWTFTPNSVGGTGRINYGGNVWGPTTDGQAFYNTLPTLPDNFFDFTYESGGAPGPKAFALAPRAGGLDAPSCAYEWDLGTYPNGTVLNPGDTILSSTISDPDCDDDSFFRLTVLSGTGTTTTARAIQMSEEFSARVEFFERSSDCPPCQDYDKKLGEVGTWGVTYNIGEPVPAELNYAAGLLACELAKSMVGDGTCALPQRVQQVARQGINIAFVDPIVLAMEGLTGIPTVDMIIRALNPYKLRQQTLVWSPDVNRNWRREL